MLVIADASPIILLSRVGRLDLLPALYGKVVVPAPVFQEVVVAGAERPGSRELQAAPWMDIAETDLDDQLLAELRRNSPRSSRLLRVPELERPELSCSSPMPACATPEWAGNEEPPPRASSTVTMLGPRRRRPWQL